MGPILLSATPLSFSGPCASRSVTEQYFGKKFKEFISLPKWEFLDYLGWGDQGDGKLFYGIYVQVNMYSFALNLACLCLHKLTCPHLIPHRTVASREMLRRRYER